MKNTTLSNPNTGVKVVASLLAASQVISAAESTEKVESLEPTTVIATKFEKSLSDVSQSVTVLDVEQLKREGNISLQDAIGYREPGVIALSTAGQRGQIGSLFIRGTTSKYSQMRLDGVRITGSNTFGALNFLGSANLDGLSDIELLKGSSSAIYGSGAIGGVLSLNTAKGSGDPRHKLSAEYGSFDSWLGSVSSQGVVDRLAYNVGITIEDKQNDSSNGVDGNDFQQLSYFARLDYDLNGTSSVGMTLRSGDSDYETPEYGDPLTNVTQESKYDYLFGSVFYENQVNEKWSTRLTLGLSKEDYDQEGFYFDAFYGSGLNASSFETNVDRYSVYWDNNFEWSEKHVTTIGAFYENAKYKSGFGFGTTERERNNYGASINHSWKVANSLTVNGTVGVEDHDDFDEELTWNAGAVYNLSEATVLKANVGTGFLAPDFSQTESNSKLEGEQSFNWDAGVEHSFNSTTISVTWFENDLGNQVLNAGIFFSPDYYNSSDKRKTSGLELAFDSRIEELNTNVFATYTYIHNPVQDEIPVQSASFGFDSELSEKLTVGCLASWVDIRNVHNTDLGLADYLLLNLHANYKVSDSVNIHARVENLLDDNYELYEGTLENGIPSVGPINGRGRGFYGGVTVSF